MAPKAKAKMGAKAKARPGILARPAAVVRRRGDRDRAGDGARMRRPAAVHVGTPWGSGVVMKFAEVNLEDLTTDQIVVVSSGVYFGATVKVAGRLQRVEVSGGQKHAWMVLTGTDHEGVLRMCTSQPQTPFQLHLCQEGCGYHESGDRYIHAVQGRKVLDETKEEDWVFNLRGVKPVEVSPVDELAELRARGEEAAPMVPGVAQEDKKDEESSSSSRKKKKKKAKKKKKKKKEEDPDDGRRPLASSQKTLKSLFGGTGLDPSDKVRKRVLRRAKSYASRSSKKKDSSSTSSSGSESHSLSQEEERLEGLFAETNKAKAIAERFPGALTHQARLVMQESLLTEMGEDPQQEMNRPVAMLYFRAQLQRKAGGAQSRELMTLCSALDHLQRGRAAQAADVLTQRVKSCEIVLGGSHWSIAQRLEVPTQENVMVAQRVEVANAQRESYQESKTRYLASGPAGRKGDEKGKLKGKGGKNRDGDYGKDGGKKGDHGDGDHKERKKQKWGGLGPTSKRMRLSPTLRILRETRGGRKLKGLALQTFVHSWLLPGLGREKRMVPCWPLDVDFRGLHRMMWS